MVRIDKLAEKLEPQLRDAFTQAIQSIRDAATIQRIADLLDRGDVDGVIEALGLDRAVYLPLERAIQAAYDAGGIAVVASMGKTPDGARVLFAFNARNLRAESYLQNHSSNLITRIVADQRAAVRQALTEALSRGLNPRNSALDLVGRIGLSGRREGGIVGLSAQQQRAVSAARAELSGGDLRAYLSRARRDRRFDRTIEKAIREGTALPRDVIDKIVGRYSDLLLQLRGETIARTETLSALHAAQEEAFRQAIDNGTVTANQVRKAWHSAGDNRVRDTHQALNGESVQMDEAFQSPSGARLLYPMDASAPPEETINCRCWVEYRIDFLANIR